MGEFTYFGFWWVLSRSQDEILVTRLQFKMSFFLLAAQQLPTFNTEHLSISLLTDVGQSINKLYPLIAIPFDKKRIHLY